MTADTSHTDRDATLARFRSGNVRVLWNVYALTEGVDVPAASCVLLARSCGHVGQYLQIAGRVLRPADDKTHSVLIDLPGVSLRHGLPTDDREYALEGEALRRSSSLPSVRNCRHCGCTYLSSARACPECGYVQPVQPVRRPRIYDVALREVYAGADTPPEAQAAEWRRLRAVGARRGWTLYAVRRQYQELFGGELPVVHDATDEEMRAELDRLAEIQRDRGYKPGWVGVKFKEIFGTWPNQRSSNKSA